MQNRAPGNIAFRCLILICLAQAFWILIHYKFTAELSEIIQRYPVGDRGTLYVVLSNSGGATVPFTYHYFIHRSIDDNGSALESLREEGRAFLITRDHDAKTTVVNQRVEVVVREKILDFSSPAFFRVDGDYVAVDVWLDAQIDSNNDD
jgi:hypothetical protein